MNRTAPNAATLPPAPISGLVLCGGQGTRIGRDKGELDYHGRPQVQWAYDLLTGLCERAYVSVRADQAGRELYARLPLVVDRGAVGGPGAGLLAAWGLAPRVAWLLLAVDMPLVDVALLRRLIGERDPEAVATAFRHADGTPEPLCAIWEPAVRARIEHAARAGRVSLRRILETEASRLLAPDDPERLSSVNSADDDMRVRAVLARQ